MRKSYQLLIMLGLCLILLAACSNQDTEENPGGAELINDEPADLVIYSNSGDSEDSWNTRFGHAIKEKFPHYNLTYIQKTSTLGLNELLTSGQTIDIYWDSIGGFANSVLGNQLQFDMTDLMKKHQVDLSRIEPTVAESVKLISPDHVYGIPVFNNNTVLYYNKDLFDRFGVDYPRDGMTWTEASELSRQMTRNDGGQQFVGLGHSETHMLLMNQLSIPFIDNKTMKSTIFSDSRWGKFFDTVFGGPANAPGYHDYMTTIGNKLPYRIEFLVKHELAMLTWLSSIIFVFPDEYGSMNWDMVALPTFEDQPGVGSQAYPTYFAITSMSKQTDQAMQVIKYLISDEVQMKLSRQGVMPVLDVEQIKQAYGQDSPFPGKNFQASFYNQFAPIPPKTQYDSLLTTPYARTVPQVVLTGDRNTIFRTAEEDTNNRIQQAMQQ